MIKIYRCNYFAKFTSDPLFFFFFLRNEIVNIGDALSSSLFLPRGSHRVQVCVYHSLAYFIFGPR